MKSKKHIFATLILPLLFGILTFIPSEKGQTQILELDQTIFGMDCTPCAKGVENSMNRLDGVQSAELDLNKGEARMLFAEQNNISLKQIRQSIIDGGFSPKQARVKVRGTVQKVDDTWQITTESGDLFLLEKADTNILESNNRRKITVEGLVAENGRQEQWVLTVRRLQPET